MGWGDEVIATGIVKQARLKTNRPICIGDGHNIFWSPVFDGNPKISKEITKDCVWIKSYPGNRPYISKILQDMYVFNEEFKVEPGELFVKDRSECDFVYIEPNIKAELSLNKDWGFDKWQKVVNSLPDVKFIQGPGRKLENVLQVDTKDFLDACALLRRAFLFVGTDGGLHHAAAAMGIPAVVVWTGFSPSKALGYKSHVNLQANVKACGKFSPCKHCTEASEAITVEMVVKGIASYLRFTETADHV